MAKAVGLRFDDQTVTITDTETAAITLAHVDAISVAYAILGFYQVAVVPGPQQREWVEKYVSPDGVYREIGPK